MSIDKSFANTIVLDLDQRSIGQRSMNTALIVECSEPVCKLTAVEKEIRGSADDRFELSSF